MSGIVASKLHVYPIKSARGIAFTHAAAGRRGFLHDRRFMLVDARGRFITQRDLRSFAIIGVRIEEESLVVTAPSAPELTVPLRPDHGDRREVEVWGDRCRAISLGPSVGQWFRDRLGVDCDLVYMPDDTHRPVKEPHGHAGDHVSFADAFPFLLASEASLEEVSRRAGTGIPMSRFRPNIVIRGGRPFEEDGYQRFKIGPVVFRATKACSRCHVINVDQETGEAGTEPLRTLGTFRKEGHGVLFGVNLIAECEGVVTVGDELRAI
jgi:hypothetical protein